MKKELSKSFLLLKTSIKKHSPEILTGIGIAGMITTTVMAVRATPKALILIEERKEEIGVNQLEAVDLIKTTWMCYVPAALTGTLSIACLIGASSVNVRRNAALATAYTLSESALKDYQEKVIEMFGEKKNEAVKDAIAKDKVEKNPVVTREVIITEKGNTLCYDAVSGRYFKGDIEKIKKAECELNRQMRDEMYISLNDFYYEIGLDNIKLGDELGWNIDDGYIDLSFSSQLASDGTPCLVIDYTIAPRYDFRNLRFISEDVNNVKSYIVMDVLVPAIKKAISDIVTNGIDMILYGEAGKSKKNSTASKVSYQKYYDGGKKDYAAPKSRTSYEYDELLFETRGDAESVLDAMNEIIAQYEVVSVADLYDLANVSNDNYAANKYGWTDIAGCRAVRVRDGYILKLPKPTPL